MKNDAIPQMTLVYMMSLSVFFVLAGTTRTSGGVAGKTAAGAGTGWVVQVIMGFFNGFPQLLQNALVSGFRDPHSPQNMTFHRQLFFICFHMNILILTGVCTRLTR
jgi:hypothetical protein